ncbi:hypothetical protein OCS_02573 [Ophiocordyceps sinensis CO18]|uniref:Tat pathway signal sequence n=2 Tax=Ophiocordyceps sinensis TaxID=72228 RepID=T5A8D0_OPHSC|nr:hypothetical protein OCS_02573 [Ophiocordyceps sinensis CO18]
MDPTLRKKLYTEEDAIENHEQLGFLPQAFSTKPSHKGRSYSLCHVLTLYVMIIVLFAAVIALGATRMSPDPGLSLWSPANGAVSYIERQHFRAALFNNTEYMGYPTEDGRTDRLWSDLYNFGISKIARQEAEKLHSPTLTIPGTKDYLVQLDVWHELHCLNDLRKVLYPEVYGGLEDSKFDNGTINRGTDMFRHWDHCIDSIRQTLMCHADVSPIPFHINVPANTGIFPRLATTHTCRNFTKIQQWSKEHWAGEWDFNLNKEKAQQIIEASGFDNSPEEDIEFLYKMFPGNKWFKHWREHDVDEEVQPHRRNIRGV